MKIKLYTHSQKGVIENKLAVILTGHQQQPGEEIQNAVCLAVSLASTWPRLDRNVSAVTFSLSTRFLLRFPPKARSSLGVGGLGPNSASPFFFSSSTLAAAGPFPFISFLHTQKQRCWLNIMQKCPLMLCILQNVY